MCIHRRFGSGSSEAVCSWIAHVWLSILFANRAAAINIQQQKLEKTKKKTQTKNKNKE